MSVSFEKVLRVSAVLLCVLMPAVAFAAGGTAEIPWFTIAGSVVNVLVFGGLVYFLGWKKIKKSLEDRKEALEAEMSAAKALKEEATEELRRVKERTASLEEERASILKEYKVLGETEKARIIEDAKAQAERIKSEARRTIDFEIEANRKALEREMLEKALTLAEEALRGRVDKKKHNAMVDKTISELGNSSFEA